MYRLAILQRNGSLRIGKISFSLEEAIERRNKVSFKCIIVDSIGTPVKL